MRLPWRLLRTLPAGVAAVALLSGSATQGGQAVDGALPMFGGLPVGCVGAAASFNHQAYCLDSDAQRLAASSGPLADDPATFGVLQLNGWQVPTRCDGNGRSGKREQVVYVHVQGAPDGSAAALPFIASRLVPGINGVFERSTGGKRAVRWVTSRTAAGCVPTVLRLTVPRTANTVGMPFVTIGNAVLQAVGGAATSRSFLVLVDSPDQRNDCGLGQVRPDTRPGPGNASNAGGAVAMVWSNCWTGLVAAHELTHTMGAVQTAAPHHTDRGHCWDGKDAMCYPDGSPQQQRLICKGPDDFRMLDCNGDDYFALYPKAGSYLATHWNSASSLFLINSKPVVLPTRPAAPTGLSVTPVDANHVRVSWTAGVTQHGALTSWRVLVGAREAFVEFDENGTYPVEGFQRKVTVASAARSVVVGVKHNVVQGFAVYATNASGDGVTSAIVSGGAGLPPAPIVATYSDVNGPEVDWTGGTSEPGVLTCTAVTVNGVRADGFTGSLAQTTDPQGDCYSTSSPTFLVQPQPGDVIQVYARNSFGSTVTTVVH